MSKKEEIDRKAEDDSAGMIHNPGICFHTFASPGGRVVSRALAVLLVILLGASLVLIVPPNKARAGALSGWKFCVDAGHGGSEPGAIGPAGTQEKDINLKVAFMLKGLLESEGAAVLMTRQSDTSVSITDRWTMANNWGANRFISIHHNAMEPGDNTTNGTETLVSTAASQESMELANSVQAALVGQLGLPNRGVKKVDYCGVLNHTRMPAILTEASFLSSAQEEQRLRDDGYLQKEAAAIMQGIHMPSSINFILPQENMISYQPVDVDLQLLGSDTVGRVDLFMNGGLVQTKTAEPYDFSLDTSGLADGTYSLRAVATYQGGRQASISRDLIIANEAKRWYFAEGTTRPGFQEWLTVMNPNAQPVDFGVTYAFDGGEAAKRDYHVEAQSRLSIEVANEIGTGRDASVIVDSPLPIIVERPMYFLYKGQWDGGHVSSGSNKPMTQWYFAEGTTRPGFEEWLCMLNPGDSPAHVKVEYVSAGGLLGQEQVTVNPWRRSTIFVNEKVAANQDVSLRVTSDQPIVAERPMYFNLEGHTDGSVSVGANNPSNNWYFAEGYTGPGFREFICLFNPGNNQTKARLTFQIQGGVPQTHEVTVPALSRYTFDVNTRIGKNLQLSASVNSDSPIVAERPMYYDYHGWCQGGDVGIGVTAASRHWFFAEGYTGKGFEDWLCMQNPGSAQVEVEIRFHTESGDVMSERHTLAPNSRTTFFVNSMNPYEEGMGFSVHASGEIIVERPIYFRYKKSWVGGTVSPGYGPGVER